MFTPMTTDTGTVLPWEYMPAKAGTYRAGALLNVNDGVLTYVGAPSTTTPGYLCMGTVTVKEGDLIPVTRVRHDVIYETQLATEAASAKIGSMLQVSGGGQAVSADAAGSFEITYIDDTAAGSTVRGRFH